MVVSQVKHIILLYMHLLLTTFYFNKTKGVIRIHKSKKDRQHNDQKKKDKGTNNDLQNIRTKLKID